MAIILIMDDDVVLAEGWAEILRDAGHQVDTAANASDALDYALGRDVDLVITDIFVRDEHGQPLPDGGLRLIGTLMAKKHSPEHPWLKHLGVMAVSGSARLSGGGDPLAMAEAVGAHVVLEKPLSWEVLVANVAMLLARMARKRSGAAGAAAV
ncbi:MAG: response regulator [Pseudomonadota bacterium]